MKKKTIMKLELLNKTDAAINFNDQEVMNKLNEQLESYQNLVFTEDTAKDCKATVSELNKLEKEINSFRLKYKKELEKPIKEFEGRCKVLINRVSEVKEPLRMQYNKFEFNRREQKRIDVQLIIDEALTVFELEKQFALQVELKDEYLNKTITLKKVKEAVADLVKTLYDQQVARNQKIDLIKSKVELANIKHDLSVKLTIDDFKYIIDWEMNLIDERISKVAENKATSERQAIENIRQAEEKKAQEQAIKTIETITESVEKFIPIESKETETEKIYTMTLQIKATESQLKALKEYLIASSINYKKL